MNAITLCIFLLPPVSQIWQDLQSALNRDGVLLITAGFIFIAGLLLNRLPSERGRVRAATLVYGLSLLLILASSLFTSAGLLTGASALRWTALLLGGAAIVNLACTLVFDLAFGAVNLHAPRILRDLVAALGYVGVGLALLRMGGVGLSDLITTSAVVTAIIAFSLQDTLGNIMGGLALQMEKSINVGDWIRIDQNVGRVKEIRWRHTAIETRNWDTVIIPNTMLMKGQVTVLGRRTGQPTLHRQWVYFNVDFRVAPTEVIEVVNEALQSEPIERVAVEPKPHCILYDFKDSYCHYAVRYWLTDLATDDPTDSVVRTRVFFALKRAGIPLSVPAQSVFVTEESEARKSFKQEREINQRLQTLAGVELFHSLNDEERRTLAERLQRAPFTKGEAVIKQGAEAHRLYIIIRGSAEVDISAEDGVRKTIATLGAGDFFGEMSLMTGEKRAATVIALEDMECYRLDKEAFHDILLARPEIAENISHVLARRRTEYEAARDGLDAEAKNRKMSHAQQDIFARISAFFGLGGKAAAG
ncbi:MAG TPA: mechanosensitive ion channel family protein [Blastocatellia bacterium]|nr:mechanosensitive ion channel family protein [Blastocatellia bacterium]